MSSNEGRMSSNEERARILRMVSEGSISPAEAEDLLSAIESNPQGESGDSGTTARGVRTVNMPAAPRSVASRRSLVIQVTEEGKSKVNVRVPLSLAQAASRFIPRQAHVYLNEREINLEQMIHDLSTADGENTLVEVTDAESYVRIAVE